MSSRSVPRLSLIARLGYLGMAGAAGLVGVLAIMPPRPAPPAPTLASRAAPVTAAAASGPAADGPALDGIDRLLGLKAQAANAAPDATGTVPASPAGIGPVTKLPMPRFVSLKTDRVNVRQGPTRDQKVSFVFQRAGLPVEVTAEFENWRRIRDADGSEGWVLQNLLSGRRTALVSPWSKDPTVPLRARPDAQGATVALLQPGVQATVKSCADAWCRLKGDGFDGWIEQVRLWGAYPGEAVD